MPGELDARIGPEHLLVDGFGELARVVEHFVAAFTPRLGHGLADAVNDGMPCRSSFG